MIYYSKWLFSCTERKAGWEDTSYADTGPAGDEGRTAAGQLPLAVAGKQNEKSGGNRRVPGGAHAGF